MDLSKDTLHRRVDPHGSILFYLLCSFHLSRSFYYRFGRYRPSLILLSPLIELNLSELPHILLRLDPSNPAACSLTRIHDILDEPCWLWLVANFLPVF